MDKLQVIIAVVKKHHFWVLDGLIVVIALAIWYVASGQVADTYTQRTGEIEMSFGQVQGIQSRHPNEDCAKWWTTRTENQKKKVLAGWTTLYNKQKADNELPKGLSDECLELFYCSEPKLVGRMWTYQVEGNPRPITRQVHAEDFDSYLEEYQNKIGDYVDKLPLIIDMREGLVNEEAGGAGRGVGDEPGGIHDGGVHGGAGFRDGREQEANEDLELTGIVEWPESDREELNAGFNWGSAPDLFVIKLAQEDLWVYQALLRIIADTNEGYTDADYRNAPIKRIDALEIGQKASRSWQDQIEEAVGLEVGMTEGADGGGGSSGGDASAHGDSATDVSEKSSRANNRYVDDKGQPLAADANGVIEQPPYAEFKMMPIRMQLLMNQESINKVLALCANSSMPIEVKQVRFKMGKPRRVSLVEGGEGMDSGSGDLGSQTLASTASGMTQPAALDGTVEIYGVIYIYNPPDLEKLGTGTASDQAVDGASTAGDPAATGPDGGPDAGSPPTQPPSTQPPSTQPPADGT